MQTLYSILAITSKRQGLIIILLLQLIVAVGLAITITSLMDVSGGYSILDFVVGYSLDDINTTFASYGVEGMALYQRIQMLDVFNPLLYGLFLASLFYIFYEHSNYQWLVICPLIAAGLDYLENIFLFIMANNFPEINTVIAQVSSYVGIVKMASLIPVFIILIVGVVCYIRNRRTADA